MLEVGLGGRLDATNIAKSCLSLITSISLEHTDLLGNSLEAIAQEKGGIIKESVPLLVGPRVPFLTLQKMAKQKKAAIHHVQGTFSDFDAENSALAKRALELLQQPIEAIEHGIKLLPVCRLEEVQPGVVLDVAHNPDGLSQLFCALEHRYPKIPYHFVCGLSKNKDLKSCLTIIKEHAQFVTLTEAQSERAASASSLADLLLQLGFSSHNLAIVPSISEAVHRARIRAQKTNSLLVICGTFFIMSCVRQALGVKEPIDGRPLVEK